MSLVIYDHEAGAQAGRRTDRNPGIPQQLDGRQIAEPHPHHPLVKIEADRDQFGSDPPCHLDHRFRGLNLDAGRGVANRMLGGADCPGDGFRRQIAEEGSIHHLVGPLLKGQKFSADIDVSYSS